MDGGVTVIDIVAQVTDETASGARSAESNVSRLERSMMNLQNQIMGMKGKSKLEVKAALKDMASKGIQSVANAGKKIAGKVWTVTLKAVDLVTAPFKKIASLIANPIAGAAGFAGISFGVADTINTFKDFEQGMANVKAISGATGADFEELTATAKRLGETTMFSAAQAAEAMENLAMAGWKSKDIVAGMPGLLDLAAAGSVDLATAADVTASAIAQFKMEAGEAGRVADVLAATATNSKTDVAGLGESLKYAGSLAGALGYSIEDVSVAFGIMGNAAIDGSSAGTALRATLARMSKQEGLTADESNAVVDAMRKLGVSLTDNNGKSKSLMTVMKDMRAGYAKLSESEQTATMANLAGQNALSGMLAIVQASDEDFDKLANAINHSSGAAAEMAGVKMDSLQGSLYYLQSAAEGVKIAIGEKLSPYVRRLVDWVTAHMPDIQNAVGSAVDFVLGKIDDVTASIQSLTQSPEWQNAETLWDKIKVAWDKLIAEPFDTWWNGTGKTWLAEKANRIGEGLGTAIKTGILGLLGVDVGGAVSDGVDIGKSFADGFLDGFDGSKVGEALAKAIKNGLKGLVLDAATLLPGGKEASGTSGLSAAVLGYGAFKTAKTGYNIYKGGKAFVNGTKAVGSAIGNVTGISEGIKIFKAAQGGGNAAQSALAMAQNGALGRGMKYGANLASGASKAGKFLSKAAVPLAAVGSTIEMGVDAYHGVGKAKEWTGSDSVGAKVASGVGAALGGTGDGVLGQESAGKKALDVGGGALKGSGIGAAVGSLILPGVGTAIGAGVGAGIGAAGAAIGGSNIAKALSTAGAVVGGFFTQTVPEKFGQFAEGANGFFTETVPQALRNVGSTVKGFFTETVPQKFGEFADGAKGFFTETVPQALSSAGNTVKSFFTETIPEKFGGLWNDVAGFFTQTVPQALTKAGTTVKEFFTETVLAKVGEMAQGIGDFLTKQVPYAIGYAVGKVQVFFTETVPTFFENLVDGVGNFFTQTVPAAIEAAGSALTTFFTQTVPQFFMNLWEGITGFFTNTVQPAIETVGATVTTFFTQTLPEFFTGLWNGVKNFFTVTVPSAIDSVGSAVTNFFAVTVPQFFENLWSGITGFFTNTVQPAIEAVGAAVTNFFTVTVSGFFGQLWEGVTGFFTETVPAALETVGTALKTFFTETVPQKMQEVWDGVVHFFTGSIPNAINSIGETIGGFFTDVKDKIAGFFGGIWDTITGSASAGYEAATATPHAEGGIMTRPHLGLVAEDGAEAIIPLSGNRRERGIDLWERTGQMLGVKAYAEGGVAGGNAPELANAPMPVVNGNTAAPFSAGGNGGGTSVPVTIQSLTVEINVDGGTAQNPQELAEAIRKNIRSMTDDIAYQLAVAMQQVYSNTPKEGWR